MWPARFSVRTRPVDDLGMRFLIQTVTLSITLTAIGAVAYDAAADYARQARIRRQQSRLLRANPGIPDAVRDGLRQGFGRR